MKYLIAIAYIASLSSCQESPARSRESVLEIHDTVFIPCKEHVTILVHDTVSMPLKNCDSLIMKFRATKRELIRTKYTLNRVRFYLNICIKNPKQDKFLKGWVSRALSN